MKNIDFIIKSGKCILIIGGSQGSHVLSNWVNDNMEHLNSNYINTICLSGQDGINKTISLSNSMIKFIPYCNKIESAYSIADIIISRAGASTLAELPIFNKKVILIPNNNVTYNHQHINALNYKKKYPDTIILDETNITNLLNIIKYYYEFVIL
jgi:UDP-N-acetylglucosamine--N-acetylmuramyl-(pentapeptide) pyrophosphoryl-undecaprenol N-acetylglucosamine transferase